LHVCDVDEPSLAVLGKTDVAVMGCDFQPGMSAVGARLDVARCPYGTIAEGPGVLVIFDAEPAVAPAVIGVAVAADTITNVKFQRLFSGEEVRAARQKRIEIQKSYSPHSTFNRD
jgi:hypothetical protein